MKDYSQTGILFDFLFWSLLLWQIGFIVGILLKLFYKPSGKKFVQTAIPAVEVVTPRVQPGHIDVEMKKKIALHKPTTSSIKSDEVIRGKVSTQKEKLKQLRRG
jgi:hypothetical protein